MNYENFYDENTTSSRCNNGVSDLKQETDQSTADNLKLSMRKTAILAKENELNDA